jgi:hypothetical protein
LSVTEPQRLALHEAARKTLGDEEGDTLMALTPPANTDIATRQDLDRVEERLGMRIVALEERLDARIELVVARASASLTKAIHHAELRMMSVIVLAFLGTRFLG